MNLKSTLIGGAAVGALALATPAQADYYVSIFGGLSHPDMSDISVGPFSYQTQVWNNHTTYGYLFTGYRKTLHTGGYLTGTSLHYTRNAYYRNTVTTVAGGFNEDEFENGFVVGGSLGVNYKDGWRAELEVAWRRHDFGEVNHVTGTHYRYDYIKLVHSWTGTIVGHTTGGATTFSGFYTNANPVVVQAGPTFTDLTSKTFQATARSQGEVTTFSIMANFWGDFDLGENAPFTPFIGAGLGAANVAVDYAGPMVLPQNDLWALSSTSGLPNNTANPGTDMDGWALAWQFGAGLDFDLGRGIALSAQYRYFGTGDVDVMGQDFSVQTHEALVAFRVPFGN